MPRVHFVKKARKDNPAVKKGESYYWWKFQYGGRQYSKTYPDRSQLTQSSFLSQLYNLEDNHNNDIEDIVQELECLLEQCKESLENMPEQLRDTSESGLLLGDRIEKLKEWIDAIESIGVEELSQEEIADEIESANPGID